MPVLAGASAAVVLYGCRRVIDLPGLGSAPASAQFANNRDEEHSCGQCGCEYGSNRRLDCGNDSVLVTPKLKRDKYEAPKSNFCCACACVDDGHAGIRPG